ncbi:MAG: hypothetical protein ACI9SP_004024 [Arenicella sp.]|jgi:hypothetical protein
MTDLLYEELQKKIKILSETVWDGRAKHDEVNIWLDNFLSDKSTNKDEQLHALYLLSKYMYFSSGEIKELLKATYRDLYKYPIIKLIRKSNNDTLNRKLIKKEFDKKLEKTRFLGVGNPSESGSHMLYYFRQENALSKDYFIHAHQIFDLAGESSPKLKDETISRYVFIDDFCGEGTQATDYLKDIIARIKSASQDVEVHYYVLFGNESGLSRVRSETLIDSCEAVFKLDETYKCFGEKSRYAPKNDERLDWVFAEEMVKKHGKYLNKFNPLGHGDCQFLIGFFHNTPNNTLPIIWKKSDKWQPIFKRYGKIYGNRI